MLWGRVCHDLRTDISALLVCEIDMVVLVQSRKETPVDRTVLPGSATYRSWILKKCEFHVGACRDNTIVTADPKSSPGDPAYAEVDTASGHNTASTRTLYYE